MLPPPNNTCQAKKTSLINFFTKRKPHQKVRSLLYRRETTRFYTSYEKNYLFFKNENIIKNKK